MDRAQQHVVRFEVYFDAEGGYSVSCEFRASSTDARFFHKTPLPEAQKTRSGFFPEMSMGLSVIVPIAEGDGSWKTLLSDLTALKEEDELILSSKTSLQDDLQGEAEKNGLVCNYFWVPSAMGRAKQLNTGACWATKNFLWFLHGDSKVPAIAVERLKKCIKETSDAIFFFDLKFLKDGPALTTVNEYGAWFRSHIMRLPFGDQGYCMHRDTFAKLGGFPEVTSYGEDHLLVWKAHQRNIKVLGVREPLYTSARRYKSFGWANTTTRHLLLTFRQAAPEFARLLKIKLFHELKEEV